MPINTTSTMSANLPVYYEKRLLDRLVKKVVLEQLTVKSLNIPKREGDTANWLRYAERHVTTPSTFQLSQGVVPADSAITTGNVTAQVAQYGNYAIITDLLELTARDPVVESVSDLLGDEAAELLDTIIRNELDTNLPNQFANSKLNIAATGANDVMTVKEGLKGRVLLRKDLVGPHESGAYVCVVSPSSEGDIMNDTNTGSFIDINKYVGNMPVLNGEIGKAYGVRYLMSENISSTTTGTLNSATVYSNLLLGKGCVGSVTLDPSNRQMFIKKAGGANSTNDPLEQINTVGYKFLGFVAKYLGGSGNSTNDRGRRIRAGSAF